MLTMYKCITLPLELSNKNFEKSDIQFIVINFEKYDISNGFQI
jgi:hypothetical protein